MREIKFRAWDVWGKKIINWREIYDNKAFSYDFHMGVTGNLIPLQYTGLKDKNGVEIYENDVIDYYGKNIIVKIPDVYIEVHENLNPEDCEVIGDIYENPELLDNK